MHDMFMFLAKLKEINNDTTTTTSTTITTTTTTTTTNNNNLLDFAISRFQLHTKFT